MKCATLSTLGLAAVLAAGCSDGATAPTASVASRPRAATVANERTPLAFTLANPCNGEVIPLSGWQHLETHATITRSQSYHFATHMNGYLEGVGARTGTRYVSTFEVHDVHNAKVDGASVYSIGSYTKVISTGDASNFFLKILVHLTFNANGDLTSQKSEFMPECRG